MSERPFQPCAFCGEAPWPSQGYDTGKVHCPNEACPIHVVSFWPEQWERRWPPDTAEKLRRLKDERDEISAEINLIEEGIRRAAYDACMATQLAAVNDSREQEGKPKLTMSQFMSGVERP